MKEDTVPFPVLKPFANVSTGSTNIWGRSGIRELFRIEVVGLCRLELQTSTVSR